MSDQMTFDPYFYTPVDADDVADLVAARMIALGTPADDAIFTAAADPAYADMTALERLVAIKTAIDA